MLAIKIILEKIIWHSKNVTSASISVSKFKIIPSILFFNKFFYLFFICIFFLRKKKKQKNKKLNTTNLKNQTPKQHQNITNELRFIFQTTQPHVTKSSISTSLSLSLLYLREREVEIDDLVSVWIHVSTSCLRVLLLFFWHTYYKQITLLLLRLLFINSSRNI